MLLGTLGASLLGNLLIANRIVRAGTGNKKGKGVVRTGTGHPLSSASQKQWDFLMPPHPLTNLKYKNIIKMNQDLVVFPQEIIYLRNKGWGTCNKS